MCKVGYAPYGSIVEQQFTSYCRHCDAPNVIRVAQIVGVKEHGEINHKCFHCGNLYKVRY